MVIFIFTSSIFIFNHKFRLRSLHIICDLVMINLLVCVQLTDLLEYKHLHTWVYLRMANG